MGRFFRWIKSKFTRRNDNSGEVITHNPGPIVYNGEKIDVKIEAMENFTEEDISKLKVSVDLLTTIINSLEFKIELTNADLIKTNGLTPSEVYNLFMSGKDAYEETSDNEMDIHITLYHARSSRVIGYTYPGTRQTWINSKYFRYESYPTICSNIAHEYAHNLNFTHRSRGYSLKSVPYAIGIIIYELCEQLLDGVKLTPLHKDEE